MSGKKNRTFDDFLFLFALSEYGYPLKVLIILFSAKYAC